MAFYLKWGFGRQGCGFESGSWFLGDLGLSLDLDLDPLKGPSLVRLVRANPLIWANSDSAGWTSWEVLTVHDEWKMALVTVLVDVERVQMAVVCPSVDTEAHWAAKRLDNQEVLCWFSSCCEGATEGGLKMICLKSQTVGYPQLRKKLAVLMMVIVLSQSL